jgi:hypothetical protein
MLPGLLHPVYYIPRLLATAYLDVMLLPGSGLMMQETRI